MTHIIIRLYQRGRAAVEGAPGVEVDAHGWDYTPGDVIEVDGVNLYEVLGVSKIVDWDRRVPGGDPYVRAEARRLV